MTAYLGVPFAQPPLGELRFCAPRPHPGWTQPLDAERFGDSPLQAPSAYTDGLALSEDCLTLNLWVPERGAGAGVLFWVYGGGFAGGSCALPIFDGARLAARTGLIVASANHRTGALGFATLTHRDLPEASNLGIRDVIAALRWIHENAGAFGADPGQVSVMGQSSGAFVAAALLAAPDADGLFQRLVLISGGASRILPESQAQRLGDQLIAAAGVADGPGLRALSGADIVAAQSQVGSQEIGARNAAVPDSLGVVLDRTAPWPVLRAHPMEVIASGARRDIPLLLVVTGAEVASLHEADDGFAPASHAELVAEIAGWGAPDAEAVVAAYHDDDLGRMRERILTDYIYRLPAARAALAHHRAGGQAWMLQVDRADGGLADHNLPTMLLFGNLPGDDPDATLSEALGDAVAGFARRGAADWARFDGPEGELMRLGADRRAAPRALADLLETWEGVPRP